MFVEHQSAIAPIKFVLILYIAVTNKAMPLHDTYQCINPYRCYRHRIDCMYCILCTCSVSVRLGYMGRPIFCTLSGYRLGWKTNLPLSRPSYSPFRALFRNSEEIMSVPISTSFTVCVTSP